MRSNSTSGAICPQKQSEAWLYHSLPAVLFYAGARETAVVFYHPADCNQTICYRPGKIGSKGNAKACDARSILGDGAKKRGRCF
jgi:hypothetical protein